MLSAAPADASQGVCGVHTVSMRPAPTGDTKVAGVIGCPVRHSLSPALHNAAFGHLDLDWTYLAFEVPAGRGADAVAAMRVLGIEGLSVTMPHKGDAATACDELAPTADLLGAVNCICREGDRLIGHNTDGAGLLRSLRSQLGLEPAGLHAVVLGAGGAARAAIVALVAAGASVTVVNRSAETAKRAAELGVTAIGTGAHIGEAPEVMVGGPRAVRDADLVINATPLGMSGTDPLPIDPQYLTGGQTVVDLIYQPSTTPLLREAARKGAVTLNGTGMLLFQAAEQFRMWTGHDAPVEVMAAAVGLDLAG